MHESWYCTEHCLEHALADELRRVRPASKRVVSPHRIPLGLLLLSRGQLTVEQLRAALSAQTAAGRGRIGEWLQTLGFATEQQVTAALARQWSCPILRENSMTLGSLNHGSIRPRSLASGSRSIPQIPLTLLRSFVMFPLDYVESTATLHIAFGEGIDYSILHAIEQILDCHTDACVAAPSLAHKNLQALSEHRAESEVVFDRVADLSESARIVQSYCARISASEIRIASCDPHLWVRLLRRSGPPLDLLLNSPMHLPPSPAARGASPAVLAV